MYAYETDKIILGKDRTITSLSWNSGNALIGIGLNDKTYKLLRMEDSCDGQAELQMSLNTTVQTSHKGAIRTMSWNENFDKLLTVDDRGMMIVWTESGQDTYVEEMVNEAGAKLIKFAKWSSSGKFIVIVIQGGSLILGSVEGARLWGKDVDMEIDFVTFLEMDKVILLGDSKGALIALDSRSGEVFSEYDFYEEECKEAQSKAAKDKPKDDSPKAKASQNANASLNRVRVFEGSNTDDSGKILIGYRDGQVYIVHNLRDNYLKKHSYGMVEIQRGVWNKSGRVFALTGLIEAEPRVLFLNRAGEVLSCLSTKFLPCHIDFNFEGNRLLVAAESTVSVINVRTSRFSVFLQNEGTAVAAFESATGLELFPGVSRKKNEWKILFLDTKERQSFHRSCENMIALLTDGSRALLVSKPEGNRSNFQYLILDKKGVVLHSLVLKFPPKNIEFKNSRVVISISCYVVVWDLSDALASRTTGKDILEKPKIYWFSLKNTTVVNNCTMTYSNIFEGEKLFEEGSKALNIVCLDVSDTCLWLCLEKGLIRRFNLQNFAEQDSLSLSRTPKRIFVNKTETCVASLDQFARLEVALVKNVLTTPGSYEPVLLLSGVNDFIWAQNSTEFAYSVKNKIYEQTIDKIGHGSHPSLDSKKDLPRDKASGSEETTKAIQTNNILIGFSTLEVITIDYEFLQKMMEAQSAVSGSIFDAVSISKTQKLRLCDLMMRAQATELSPEFQEYVSNSKNSVVCDYCANSFLAEGKFDMAHKLYTISENFLALRFIEKLKNGVENDYIKLGEALMFLGRTKEAIGLLTRMNMSAAIPRLLIAYGKIKGIDRFFHLIDVNAQNQILKHLGDNYRSTGELKKAIKVFEKVDDRENLMGLYFQTKNFESLYQMLPDLKDKSLLFKYADLLTLSGNTDLAARAYEKCGESKKAVDTAILGNCWSTAVEIAERQDFKQIDSIIHKFAAILSENRNKLDLVKLYRKAKKNAEAAKILNSLASDLIGCKTNPLIIKKVFVLAALEVHLYNKKNTDVNMTSNLTNITLSDTNSDMTKRALTTLITSDLNNISEKILTNPWRGAEAWHYLILSLRLFKTGEVRQALKVALRLTNFELELGEERVNCLIAILTYKCGFFRMFSKSLSKLEAIYHAKGNRDMVERIESLAVNTFSTTDPKDVGLDECETFPCLNKNCTAKINEFDFFCPGCNSNFGMCVLSGNNIYVKQYTKCAVCQHKILNSELERLAVECCPLCHSKLKKNKVETQKTQVKR